MLDEELNGKIAFCGTDAPMTLFRMRNSVAVGFATEIEFRDVAAVPCVKVYGRLPLTRHRTPCPGVGRTTHGP